MATQGILSVVENGKVIVKAITGVDGYLMPKIADEIVSGKISSAKSIFDLCLKHGLGGDSLIVQSSPDAWVSESDCDGLPESYALNFDNPAFNPRWEFGTADYVEIVEIESGNYVHKGSAY